MKISTKGRYALRLAIDVAQQEGNGPVSLRESSERQGISVKYLEQLAGQMTRSGVLISTRGARGGYSLGKPADQITAGDILRVCEGGTAPLHASRTISACARGVANARPSRSGKAWIA